MKKYPFHGMSPDKFAEFRPKTQDEDSDYQKEKEFRNWCAENEDDPEDDGIRELYREIQRECGYEAWNDMDENDREGWEHNIIKSFD